MGTATWRNPMNLENLLTLIIALIVALLFVAAIRTFRK
jgi:hypothetical protein